jgi:hypothetical protein
LLSGGISAYSQEDPEWGLVCDYRFRKLGSQVRKKWKAAPARAITGVTSESAQKFNMGLKAILQNMGNELVKVLKEWKQRKNSQRTI